MHDLLSQLAADWAPIGASVLVLLALAEWLLTLPSRVRCFRAEFNRRARNADSDLAEPVALPRRIEQERDAA